MTFVELLDQAITMLQRRGRVSYRTPQRQFTLDDTALEDLKEAILFAYPQVLDEAGRGLVWPEAPAPAPVAPSSTRSSRTRRINLPSGAHGSNTISAHESLGNNLFFLGEYTTAQRHLEQAIAIADPTTQRELMFRHGVVPGVTCLTWMANTLWCMGYPDQAVRQSEEALVQAQAHPHTLALAHHQALIIARHQQAKSWELRAATSEELA
jgi:hypothetical protein